jgi:uncharacterized protein YwqG
MNFLRKILGINRTDSEKITNTENSSDELEQRFQNNLKALENYKRTAFIPQTSIVDREHSSDSKIGGLPYLRSDNDWPICPNCKKHMQLFLQLDLSKLPVKNSSGLIQLFYCTSNEPLCESELEAFFPFSKAVECRKIEIQGKSKLVDPKIDEIFEEKRIIQWVPKTDYPHFEEYGLLGIDIEVDDDVYSLMEERNIGLPLQGDKLFGWPYWVQSVEYPRDRSTKNLMELLFQLDSEVNLPHMFGDAGIGHLTQSLDNDNELGFGWACS